MPSRNADRGRCGAFWWPIAVLVQTLGALSLSAPSASAQELPFIREYPGAAPYRCPAFDTPQVESEEARTQAAQLASSAAQSVILGDRVRALALLDRAIELDPASAELAYRRARVLEDLAELPAAVSEYCRALAIAGDGSAARDARARLDALMEAELDALPEEARTAMGAGLEAVDRGRFSEALTHFDVAVREAPTWAAATYNRGVVLARLGRNADAAASLGRYLDLRVDAPDGIAVSRRIGQLQTLALGEGPSPGAALALGTILPGMGHFYAGRPQGGLAVLSLAGGALAAGFFIKEVDVRCLTSNNPGGCPPEQVVETVTKRPYLTTSLFGAAAIGLVGAVEAFIEARGRRAAARAPRVEASAPRAGAIAPRAAGASLSEPGRLLGPGLFVMHGTVALRLIGLRLR